MFCPYEKWTFLQQFFGSDSCFRHLRFHYLSMESIAVDLTNNFQVLRNGYFLCCFTFTGTQKFWFLFNNMNIMNIFPYVRTFLRYWRKRTNFSKPVTILGSQDHTELYPTQSAQVAAYFDAWVVDANSLRPIDKIGSTSSDSIEMFFVFKGFQMDYQILFPAKLKKNHLNLNRKLELCDGCSIINRTKRNEYFLDNRIIFCGFPLFVGLSSFVLYGLSYLPLILFALNGEERLIPNRNFTQTQTQTQS